MFAYITSNYHWTKLKCVLNLFIEKEILITPSSRYFFNLSYNHIFIVLQTILQIEKWILMWTLWYFNWFWIFGCGNTILASIFRIHSPWMMKFKRTLPSSKTEIWDPKLESASAAGQIDYINCEYYIFKAEALLSKKTKLRYCYLLLSRLRL